MLRRFVALALIAGALVVPSSALADSNYPHLDPAKVGLIQRLTGLLDKLPQKTYPITLENSSLFTAEWEVEILPFYAHAGIVDSVTPPAAIRFFFQPYGSADDVDMLTFHILGLSECGQIEGFADDGTAIKGPIWLNGRFINPVSPWYQDASYLPTLVHELGHSMGICDGPSDYIESSTQVATIAVLAAMANAGLDGAILGLLDEYRSITQGALLSDALRTNHLAEYESFWASVHPSARDRAQHAFSSRFWYGNKARLTELKGIVSRYELTPYVKIQYALAQPCLCLAASASRGRLFAPHVLVPSGAPLSLADLSYFLATADERIGELLS